MSAAVPPLGRDERGSFLVLEAILVALLVLTAILFFTSVQRPTTGSEQGGLDLAQVSADTLQILQTRSFTVAAAAGAPHTGTLTFEQWVTNLAYGDAATANEVGDFVEQILPTGARYSLRLDNGVSTLAILPPGGAETAHGARAASIVLLPRWAAFSDPALAATYTVAPGQVLAASEPAAKRALVEASATHQCYQAPTGHSQLRDGPDADAAADTWRSHWQAAPGAGAPWKAVQAQVPADALLGKWRVYPDAGCSGTPVYVEVVRPACLAPPTPAACSSPYVPYGLQLVVWYGA